MSTLTQLVARCQGMVMQPSETLRNDAVPPPPWWIVMGQHLAPLTAATAAFALATRLVFGPMSGGDVAVAQTLFAILAFLITTAAVALVMKSVAGISQGRGDFDSAFALLALSQTPALLGQALQALGGIGALVAIAGAIYSLVILFKGIPIVLGVPEDERWKVFGVTFMAAAMIQFMLLSIHTRLFGVPVAA